MGPQHNLTQSFRIIEKHTLLQYCGQNRFETLDSFGWDMKELYSGLFSPHRKQDLFVIGWHLANKFYCDWATLIGIHKRKIHCRQVKLNNKRSVI